jgi:dethiobiotin synthetase
MEYWIFCLEKEKIMMASYFITATGTGMGKTFVTAALAYQLQQSGKQASPLKPVISGFEPRNDSDTAILAQASGMTLAEHTIEAISPWRFAAPLAPYMAAAQEGREVPFDALVGWCHERVAQPGITLIEGVGGLMVPLNSQQLVIDWIEAVDIPVIVVGGSYLGAINHMLLSLEALQGRNIAITGVVISQSPDCCGLAATCDAIAAFAPTNLPLIPLPRVNSWKNAPDLLSLLV